MSDDNEYRPAANQKFVPVCAIGASAGGIGALQNFFRHIPTELGLAYVVILHLSPDEPSSLDDILAGCTPMPVHQVISTATLKPDCVFVIPPDRELVIDGDGVTARAFSEPRGQRAPIARRKADRSGKNHPRNRSNGPRPMTRAGCRVPGELMVFPIDTGNRKGEFRLYATGSRKSANRSGCRRRRRGRPSETVQPCRAISATRTCIVQAGF
ncbi:chemotaxis protein CheB [Ensifer sp. NPDC090286]|uniref:chemotaxis protein CheB n=1 Tax=Ensifer sp. NPDC090286 TaxID=3363991 RepID=UPI00383BC84A